MNPVEDQTPPVQPIISSPVPSEISTSRKPFPKMAIILVAVLILLIAGASTFVLQSKSKNPTAQVATVPNSTQTTMQASPSPTSTADWKEYQNKNMGILLYYPSYYIIQRDKEDNVYIHSSRKNATDKNYMVFNDTNEIGLEIFIDEPTIIPKNDSLDQYIALAGKDHFEFHIQNANYITLGGMKAYHMKVDAAGWIYDAYLVFYNGKRLFIRKAPSGTVHQKEFDQILSTFKFTDQNSTSITPAVFCMPRPSCLDTTPRCMIAEPANGWCASSPSPVQAVSNLPKDRCPCWDSTNNTCLPQSDCQ